MLELTLRKPLAKGEGRPLTPKECEEIVRCGTSVRPRYGKRWRVMRDDDGSLSIGSFTKSNAATWAVIEKSSLEDKGIIALALSTTIAVGERRSPSVTELHAIFDGGVSVMPGAQLSRGGTKSLLLLCGTSRWSVKEIAVPNAMATPRPLLNWCSLPPQSRSIVCAMF